MKEILNIIKIGGHVINDESSLNYFLSEFNKIDGAKILVHGGGKIATSLSEKLNIPVKMVEGKRITDSATLDIAVMAYAGLINKKITAKLQSINCNAIGLSGTDANCITAQKRNVKTIDYGYVGDINETGVNCSFFNLLISKDITPVLCAISHDSKGQLLNTNADSIASSLAVALSELYEVKLIFCFEKNGVLLNTNNENSVIKKITETEYVKEKQNGIITDGMIAKLDNAFKAIAAGVKYVQIGKSDKIGKLILDNNYEGTRLSK